MQGRNLGLPPEEFSIFIISKKNMDNMHLELFKLPRT